MFELAREWVSAIWGLILASSPVNDPDSHAPIAVAMMALLVLIFERFWRKTVCLLRSWWVGLIRGTTLGWGLAAFLYWTERKHFLLFALAGAAFEALTDARDPERRRQTYSASQIAEWIPRVAKSGISEIGFDRPIQTWKDDAVGRQEFVETVLTRVLVDGGLQLAYQPILARVSLRFSI
jgi:hypothetical protein